eukprot:scaffold5910_cov239-Pinguiococcus_pyrenoidosus.AAC.1
MLLGHSGNVQDGREVALGRLDEDRAAGVLLHRLALVVGSKEIEMRPRLLAHHRHAHGLSDANAVDVWHLAIWDVPIEVRQTRQRLPLHLEDAHVLERGHGLAKLQGLLVVIRGEVVDGEVQEERADGDASHVVEHAHVRIVPFVHFVAALRFQRRRQLLHFVAHDAHALGEFERLQDHPLDALDALARDLDAHAVFRLVVGLLRPFSPAGVELVFDRRGDGGLEGQALAVEKVGEALGLLGLHHHLHELLVQRLDHPLLLLLALNLRIGGASRQQAALLILEGLWRGAEEFRWCGVSLGLRSSSWTPSLAMRANTWM